MSNYKHYDQIIQVLGDLNRTLDTKLTYNQGGLFTKPTRNHLIEVTNQTKIIITQIVLTENKQLLSLESITTLEDIKNINSKRHTSIEQLKQLESNLNDLTLIYKLLSYYSFNTLFKLHNEVFKQLYQSIIDLITVLRTKRETKFETTRNNILKNGTQDIDDEEEEVMESVDDEDNEEKEEKDKEQQKEKTKDQLSIENQLASIDKDVKSKLESTMKQLHFIQKIPLRNTKAMVMELYKIFKLLSTNFDEVEEVYYNVTQMEEGVILEDDNPYKPMTKEEMKNSCKIYTVNNQWVDCTYLILIHFNEIEKKIQESRSPSQQNTTTTNNNTNNNQNNNVEKIFENLSISSSSIPTPSTPDLSSSSNNIANNNNNTFQDINDVVSDEQIKLYEMVMDTVRVGQQSIEFMVKQIDHPQDLLYMAAKIPYTYSLVHRVKTQMALAGIKPPAQKNHQELIENLLAPRTD